MIELDDSLAEWPLRTHHVHPMLAPPFNRAEVQALLALIRRDRMTDFQAIKLDEAKEVLTGMLDDLDAQDIDAMGHGS